MREVQVTEAKARLAKILSAVEKGESFSITRRGKPIAHLVPAVPIDATTNKAAVERFRERRAQWDTAKFSIEDIMSARHDRHRA